MAVLSAPSNTPTLDGTTAVCTSDDATGTVYLSVRTDRQWYSVANGDSQVLADADKAVIIAGTTDANIVFAANQAASLDPEQLIDGLAARLDPANPYYVGWVQYQAGSAQPAATMFVSPTGSDANDGLTIGTPLLSPNVAFAQAVAGDVIEYADGIYSSTTETGDHFNYCKDSHGTAISPIIHRAAEGATVIFDDAGTSLYGTFIESSTWIEIHNIQFSSFGKVGVNVASRAQNITLKGCKIVGNGNRQPTECDLSEWVQLGLGTAQTTYGLTVDGCYFEDNGRITQPACSTTDNYAHDHHIYCKGNGVTIQNCIFILPTHGFSLKIDGHFTYPEGFWDGAWYEASPTPDPAKGLYTHIVRNNTFIDNGRTDELDTTGGGGVRHHCNRQAKINDDWEDTWPIGKEELTPYPIYYNNLQYKTGGQGSGNSANDMSISITADNESPEGLQRSNWPSTHYNLMTDTGYLGGYIGNPQGLDNAAVIANITVTDVTLNQDFANMFVDVAGGDYHLQTGAAAKAAGSALSYPETDFDGNPRANPPSIGAYE